MTTTIQDWAARKKKADRRAAGKAGSDESVVATIQAEAKDAGATLKNDGKGGLDPRLALTVFRRDKWTCQVPNCKEPQENLDLDHIGGHAHELEEDPEASTWLKEQAEKGKQNTPDGLHVLCARHHDMVHQRDRAIEEGETPPPMKNADRGGEGSRGGKVIGHTKSGKPTHGGILEARSR